MTIDDDRHNDPDDLVNDFELPQRKAAPSAGVANVISAGADVSPAASADEMTAAANEAQQRDDANPI